MYNNPYMPYNNQSAIDRINTQMAELEKMKEQLQKPVQPPSINQTFQLASSSNSNMKYANNIEDVNKELVFNDTAFFTKDLSQMWLKNAKGEIKTYQLNEIVEKDEKDILITSLQMQIEELRKEIKQNAKSVDDNVNEPITSSQSTNGKLPRTSTKKQQ